MELMPGFGVQNFIQGLKSKDGRWQMTADKNIVVSQWLWSLNVQEYLYSIKKGDQMKWKSINELYENAVVKGLQDGYDGTRKIFSLNKKNLKNDDIIEWIRECI